VEFEELPITMADCEMSIYGEALYQHLLFHPRRTANVDCAKFAVFPPYLTYEMHWPKYGFFRENMAIQGRDCYEAAVGEALVTIENYSKTASMKKEFFIVLVDLDPYWFHTLDAEVYNHSKLSWAKLNTLEHVWRPGMDVSMPPPASEHLMRYKHSMRATLPRKYLVTFMGKFRTHPVRALLGKLHDPGNGILILNTEATHAGRLHGNVTEYEFVEIMARAKYTLVVRGDAQYSYRFTEAVCSGSVPVLISDGWVPPFSSLLPFDKYGVRISEKDTEFLIEKLNLINDQDWMRLQNKALTFCHRSLISVHHQWDTMLDIYFKEIR
jgi:hypothetical protein